MARYVALGRGYVSIGWHAQVDNTKLPCLAQWKRDFTMETILIELRRYVVLAAMRVLQADQLRYMALPQNKKLPQPPEGTTF
jgi:ubiquitin-conjugating enzyme E2 variant